ncbi:MAG: hypothetical protein DRO90_00605 [Candidatus Altiarchaeales archaeon]|nr:MAG: hypothetical protein DRO90_00605 [Candidatus Altiarchaeales archaeon]
MNKIDKKILFNIFVFLSVLLLLSQGCAATKKILFYETEKTSSKYRIDKEYSKFKETLEENGYSVSRIELDITRSALENYDPDVVVIVELQKSLSADEMAAIFEFVMQDGKGLFICGGTQTANQITIPFGMTIDTGMLEDETSPIYDAAAGKNIEDKTNFVITRLNRQDKNVKTIIQGINWLAFFGGYGISVSENAIGVAFGDHDTYSPKSIIFTKGTKPPIAAASRVGNGLVFLLSDADMLSNTNLDTSRYRYDNLKFGLNIVKWLANPPPPAQDKTIDELTMTIAYLNTEIDDMNMTIRDLNSQISTLNSQVSALTQKVMELEKENERLRSQVDPLFKIKYTTWAIGMGIIAIVIIAMSMARRVHKIKLGEKKEIEGFGYEFDKELGDIGGIDQELVEKIEKPEEDKE